MLNLIPTEGGGIIFLALFTNWKSGIEELLDLLTLELNWENIYSGCFDLLTGKLFNNFSHLSCSAVSVEPCLSLCFFPGEMPIFL